MLLTQRKAKNTKIREAELLQKLNEECVLPNHQLQIFYFLSQKRKEKELPEISISTVGKVVNRCHNLSRFLGSFTLNETK